MNLLTVWVWILSLTPHPHTFISCEILKFLYVTYGLFQNFSFLKLKSTCIKRKRELFHVKVAQFTSYLTEVLTLRSSLASCPHTIKISYSLGTYQYRLYKQAPRNKLCDVASLFLWHISGEPRPWAREGGRGGGLLTQSAFLPFVNFIYFLPKVKCESLS